MSESHLLVPIVMKKALDMPPLVTIFTVVFWGEILGLPGLLLAIPLNMVAWAIFDNFLRKPATT